VVKDRMVARFENGPSSILRAGQPPLLIGRMRQLLHQRRIWPNLSPSRSRYRNDRLAWLSIEAPLKWRPSDRAPGRACSEREYREMLAARPPGHNRSRIRTAGAIQR